MKLPINLAWFAIWLSAGTISVLGAEPEPDPFSESAQTTEATETTDRPWSPDHLEPIRAYDPDGYDQAVFKSLIGDKRTDLWMIGKPSFSPEYAVILRHEPPYAQADEAKKWIVEYVEAKQQIWHWKDMGEGKSQLDIHPTSELTRHQSEVNEAFATAMANAWQMVLRKTRYPDKGWGGLDGTTFQFHRDPNLFGETWSPRSGLPSLITELGHRLGELAKLDGKPSAALTEQCMALAEKIRTHASNRESDAAQPVPSPKSATGSQEKAEPKAVSSSVVNVDQNAVEMTLMVAGDPDGGKLQAGKTGCAVIHFLNRAKTKIFLPTSPQLLGKGRIARWNDASYLSPKQGEKYGSGYRAAFSSPKAIIEFFDAQGNPVLRDASIQMEPVGMLEPQSWASTPILYSTPVEPGTYTLRFTFDNSPMKENLGHNSVDAILVHKAPHEVTILRQAVEIKGIVVIPAKAEQLASSPRDIPVIQAEPNAADADNDHR